MRAIVNTGPDRLELLELSAPEPGPGQARIRTGAFGICATDLAMVAGWERTPFPAIPGHEWSGTVDAVGNGVDKSLVGKRCVADNVQSDGGEVGFEHPGGYAEYLIIDAANIQLLPSDFPFTTAALIEPLAVSVRGMRRLRDDAAGPVLIIGDGPIGLIMTLLYSRKGVEVVTAGGREYRLEIAQEFGAVRTLNYHDFDGDIATEVRERTGLTFPTVVEASGSGSAMNACIDIGAKGGRVLVIGDYGPAHAGFRWNSLLWQELELIGSNASAGAWEEAVRLAVEEQLPLDRLISHRLKASDFEQGFHAMRERSSKATKVVIEWD